jgi:hypothetical protein
MAPLVVGFAAERNPFEVPRKNPRIAGFEG